MHIGNKRKKFLILGKGPTQTLDDTTLTAEAQYAIYSPRSNGKFFYVCIIIGAKVFYLLMLRKYINSKQNVLT